MEEEDPVVQEIPVFLSQALSKNLYIYQYPVRPANRDWKDVKVLNASVKPKNQLVRLEVELDTYSDKYCPSKGEQIALNTDGHQESSWHVKEKDRSQYFRHGIMDKIVFESSSPCNETQHYAVAILQDKELHCTPIQGVVQMRPSYSYFDKQDKHRNDKNKNEDSDEEEKEPEPQQVTVKFARQETDIVKKAREKSYETISKKISEEPWYDALWRHSDTDYADLERLKLFSMTMSEGSALTVPAKEYVRALVPPPPADEADVAPAARPPVPDQLKQILLNAYRKGFVQCGSSKCDVALQLFIMTMSEGSALTVPAKEYVRALVPPPPADEADVAPAARPPVHDQLKQILLNAKLMTFNDLRALVRTDDGPISESALLSALSACACCVRGLWAARSAELYTHAARVPARLMCAARDHALYLFTQHPYIDRRKVAAAVRLPPLEVLEIIQSVAKYNSRTGWELLIPPDTAFEAKYPDVIQRQNLYWEARQRQFNEMLIGENIPKRQRKKSQRESVGSDTMLSPKPRCNSVSEEDSDRKRHKNKSATGSGKRTRNVSSSSAHDGT